MTGGEHCARAVQQTGGEIQLVGRGQPDAHHIESLTGDSPGEGISQTRRTVTHVVADHHRTSGVSVLLPQHPGERRTDIGHEVLVNVDADQAADVVGLEDLCKHAGCISDGRTPCLRP